MGERTVARMGRVSTSAIDAHSYARSIVLRATICYHFLVCKQLCLLCAPKFARMSERMGERTVARMGRVSYKCKASKSLLHLEC